MFFNNVVYLRMFRYSEQYFYRSAFSTNPFYGFFLHALYDFYIHFVTHNEFIRLRERIPTILFYICVIINQKIDFASYVLHIRKIMIENERKIYILKKHNSYNMTK